MNKPEYWEDYEVWEAYEEWLCAQPVVLPIVKSPLELAIEKAREGGTIEEKIAFLNKIIGQFRCSSSKPL